MLSRLIQLAQRLGRPRPGQLLVAGGLFIGLTLAAGVTGYVVASRQSVIDDAVREMRNDALMLAEEQDRLLQAVDVVQIGLIEHMRQIGIDSPQAFEQRMTSREVYQNLRDRIAGLSYVGALSLSDQHGDLLNFSRAWPPPSFKDTDRDFFHELTLAGAPPTFISEPSRSKINGEWIIYLSRRFEAADGTLIGFVLNTIQVSYFEQFYARLPLTGGGTFSLYRRDRMLIARYPHLGRSVGTTYAGTANFRHLLGALDHGVVHHTSLLDGRDRLIVPYAMPHFPLIVAVGDTMQAILAAWMEEVRILFTATALLELAIAETLMAAVRHLRSHATLQEAEAARARAEAYLDVAAERESAAHILHQHSQRYELALDNMLQGLLMYDSTGQLLLVNQRFIKLFDLPEDAARSAVRRGEMGKLVVGYGNVTSDDMAAVHAWRATSVAGSAPATFVWNLADGRVVLVTHKAMPDGWLETYEDATERHRADVRMAHMARHDALTDLPNRVLFRENLEHALPFARRGQLLALHYLDLDQFKAVNDTLGHPIGDALLQAVAQRLRDGLRDTDTVARLGGDEFAIVQTMIDSPHAATGLADRLIKLIEAPFDIEGHHIVVGTSIGIAFAPQDGVDADQLLKCADLALYLAKVDGRGVYRLFQPEMDAAMQARRVLELDLRQALDAGQLEVFYQPLIDVRARRVAGFEALLRWRHPMKGLVSPDEFIPLAEETGLIVPIGEWMLRKACAAAATWPGEPKVAVNLSVVQFKSRDLVDAVVAALDEAGLPASRLELEITETAMLRDTDATLARMHQLHTLGIRIAMDDFGTGYSSLSYLRRFPFDRIKIGRSFIRELGTLDDCIAIVRAVVALGRDLGMAITAEGVETRQQLETLERAGCTEVQGYLFSRPVPISEVIELLRSMPILTEVWPPFDVRIPSAPVEAPARLRVLSV